MTIIHNPGNSFKSSKLVGEPLVTFDDVLLKPAYSEILPNEVDTSTQLTKKIRLAIPIISAAMDTVTESGMAIAMAQNGGLGCIHKNLSPEQQAKEAKMVKKTGSMMITEPVTIDPEASVLEAVNLMARFNISGIPVVDGENKLIGIVTNRDVRFIQDESVKVYEVMSKNLVTAKPDITKEEARKIIQQHKIEKLIIVDNHYKCVGLITVKDIENKGHLPLATRNAQGALVSMAAIGASLERDLARAEKLVASGVDILVVDTAHGHSKGVVTMVKKLREIYKNDIDLVAGNIATSEGALALIEAGVDAVKVGIGPGSICTTRIVAGIGIPQLSAIMDCQPICEKYGIPIIADGGIKSSGDVAKAIAAGANVIMSGSMFAGTEESPGDTIFYRGKMYKKYRGMGSLGAMERGSADRYFQQEVAKQKLIPEGVEAKVPFKGSVGNVLHQLVGGLRAAMGYTGSATITDLQKNTQFIRITDAGMKESNVHDVAMFDE